MLMLGFKGLKGIFHNIILIILVILPLTGSPHVKLINVIQTLKITGSFVHYQGSMVDQKSLLPAWKNINCTHSANPYRSETQGRVSCRSGEKALKNFHHTYFFSQPNRLSPGMPTPHFVYHNTCAPSLTRSLSDSHAPSFHGVGVCWFPATRAVNMRKFFLFFKILSFFQIGQCLFHYLTNFCILLKKKLKK